MTKHARAMSGRRVINVGFSWQIGKVLYEQIDVN